MKTFQPLGIVGIDDTGTFRFIPMTTTAEPISSDQISMKPLTSPIGTEIPEDEGESGIIESLDPDAVEEEERNKPPFTLDEALGKHKPKK